MKRRALTLGDLRHMLAVHAELPDSQTVLLRSPLPDKTIYLIEDGGFKPVGASPAVYLALVATTVDEWVAMSS